MKLLDKALVFATNAHEGQVRKGTMRPYIAHPIEVSDIVAGLTTDEDVVCAAVLHDTVEDCEGVTKELLEKEFNARIASLVASETEDKAKTWMERKQHTIDRIGEECREVKMICLADKLSNMRDIDRDYKVVGEELWNRFRMKDKKIIGWYYKSIRDALKSEFGKEAVFKEYCELIRQNFGEE